MMRPGGKHSLATWTNVGWLEPVQVALPDFASPAPLSGEWGTEENIKRSFEEAGFTDIKVEAVEHATLVESPELLLSHMRGLIRLTLDEEAGSAILQGLKRKHGDGEFLLDGWRALVVTGTARK